MVLALVVLQVVRGTRLVSKPDFINERDSRLPVSGKDVSRGRAMEIVLATGEIPHEITPIHPVHLIIKEEGQILEEGWLLVLGTCHLASAAVHIGLIELYVLVIRAPHTREEHLAG